MDRNVFTFKNNYYKKEWTEWVPGFEGKVRYCDGTYVLRGNGSKVVYDGATNYMGRVQPDGSFVSNDGYGAPVDEYERTFLLAAKEN